jgi:circadian clock protein KaiC
VVIIDSLNGYLNSMPQDKFLTAQLHELLSYLNNTGVTTFMVVAQSGLIGGMSSPVDASYLADSVVVLRYYEHIGSLKKAISVLKKRTGSHEESIRQLWFDSAGIHLSDPLLKLRGILTGLPAEIGGQSPESDRLISTRHA